MWCAGGRVQQRQECRGGIGATVAGDGFRRSAEQKGIRVHDTPEQVKRGQGGEGKAEKQARKGHYGGPGGPAEI